ncbi:MAG: thioredoxin domain-containing protein [Aggregatilineales bacterium]
MKARQTQLILIGIVVVIALVAVVALIAVSGRDIAPAVAYGELQQTRGDDGAFRLGNPDAPVTIIEFADFACPACQTYLSEIQRFKNEYVRTGRAQFEFRMFPTAGGALSVFTGKVAECADQQQPGSFWRAYDLLYELAQTGRYTEDVGRTVAQELGLNYSQLLTCTNTAEQVNIDTNFGRNRGVTGTPAIMIRYNNGEATWIVHNGVTYNRGGVPFNILAAVVEANS